MVSNDYINLLGDKEAQKVEKVKTNAAEINAQNNEKRMPAGVDIKDLGVAKEISKPYEHVITPPTINVPVKTNKD